MYNKLEVSRNTMVNFSNLTFKFMTALFLSALMVMSTTTTTELMNSISQQNTSASTTEQIPFSETIIHQSRENIFNQVVTQWGAGGSVTGNLDDEACTYIKQYFWSLGTVPTKNSLMEQTELTGAMMGAGIATMAVTWNMRNIP